MDNTPVWIDGHAAQTHDPVDLAGLRPGSVVSLAGPAGTGGVAVPAGDPVAALHLAVTAGPCNGTCAPLPPGPALVGRAPDCDIRLADPTVSNRHFRVETDYAGRVTVEDLGSTHGLIFDGRAVTGPTEWPVGSALVAGDTVVELRPASAPDAVVHPVGLVGELRRPPRITFGGEAAPIDWPEPPATRPGPVVPLASAALPLVLGLVMFVATYQVLMLLFLLMTPVLVIANFVTTKRSGRKMSREATRVFEEQRAAAEKQLAEAQAAERAGRAEAHPDPAVLLGQVTGPRHRLWERRPGAPDFLDVRIGTATLASWPPAATPRPCGSTPSTAVEVS